MQPNCAAVYTKFEDENGAVSSNLLCFRTRVAPINKLTIPRLELQGAILLTTLVDRIRNSLSIDPKNIYCFTDSKIALSWITNGKINSEVFIRNRIAKIVTLVKSDQ